MIGVVLYWISIIVCLYVAYLIVFRTYLDQKVWNGERDKWGDKRYEWKHERLKLLIILDILLFVGCFIPVVNISLIISILGYLFIVRSDDNVEVRSILFKKV